MKGSFEVDLQFYKEVIDKVMANKKESYLDGKTYKETTALLNEYAYMESNDDFYLYSKDRSIL